LACIGLAISIRRKAGMTQEQVAAKMGVSQPSLALKAGIDEMQNYS
jgi:transcriptional regulator with XRE-family HTH domain